MYIHIAPLHPSLLNVLHAEILLIGGHGLVQEDEEAIQEIKEDVHDEIEKAVDEFGKDFVERKFYADLHTKRKNLGPTDSLTEKELV
jgi:hypothetical protein